MGRRRPRRELRSVEWRDGEVILIDQTLLPLKLKRIRCRSVEEVADAIRRMVVRGAPAIGVAAALGLALVAKESPAKSKEELLKELEGASKLLASTRPTAMNLTWALRRILDKLYGAVGDVEALKSLVIREAVGLMEEDLELNRALGRHGAQLIEDGDTILTHCNAGALATVGYGTALGILRAAKEEGKCLEVYVAETRPALQGARLTAYELIREGIRATVVADTAIGYVMKRGLIKKVLVGADRITSSGHTFNKIGTYQIALLAKEHGIPLIVAAPTSSFDLASDWRSVKIEERPVQEVVQVRGRRIAPRGARVMNPAFDITPPQLIYAIVTERGIIRPVEEEGIRRLVAKG